MGDLEPSEIEHAQKLLRYPDELEVEEIQNGIETIILVTKKARIISKKDHGEQVARFCQGVSQEAPRTESKAEFEGGLRRIQEDEKVPE